MKKFALLVTLSCLPLAGCASLPGRSADIAAHSTHQSNAVRDALRAEIRNQPTNAALHFEHGTYLLSQGTYADLVLARVAFSTAAQLAPDWWEPELGLAAVEAQSGNSVTALAAFLRAGEKRGDVDALSLPIALAAYRAGYFQLSANAWSRARMNSDVGPAADQARRFLEAAFSGTGAYETAQLSERMRGAGEPAPFEASPNVTINAYIIKRSHASTSSIGLNLLESLQLQFGATLINQSYEKSTDMPADRQISRNLAVSIPTVTYALQIAQTNETAYNLESSPSVVATEGQLSRFFEGQSLTILIAGNALVSSTQLDKDIGVDLQVTPVTVSADYVDLSATLDVSELSGNSFTAVGIQTIQTDKTTTQSNARVPFGRALAIGLGSSSFKYEGNKGVPYLKDVPGLGYLSGTRTSGETRQETVVLIAVSRDDVEPFEAPIDEAALARQLFNSEAPAPDRVSRLPSSAPALDYVAWLSGDLR
ncbi:MAG: hypothetical protein ACK46Q_11880 [Hyphomonas sp.]